MRIAYRLYRVGQQTNIDDDYQYSIDNTEYQSWDQGIDINPYWLKFNRGSVLNLICITELAGFI